MTSGSGSRCTIAADQCASTERDRTRATRVAAAAAGMVAAAAAGMAAAEVGNDEDADTNKLDYNYN